MNSEEVAIVKSEIDKQLEIQIKESISYLDSLTKWRFWDFWPF
jgi:hypothetical protein